MPDLKKVSVRELPISVLKEELKRRGLSTDGVKVVLIVRLNKAIREETRSDIESPKTRPLGDAKMSQQQDSGATADGATGEEEKKTVKVGNGQENVENEGLDESHDLEIVDEPEPEEVDPEDVVEVLNTGGAEEEPKEQEKPEEEPEGEDEFEEDDEDVVPIEKAEEPKEDSETKKDEKEAEEPKEKPAEDSDAKKEEKEPEDVPNNTFHSSPEDEIFLDYEEDLLDDPLMEQEQEQQEQQQKEQDLDSGKTMAGATQTAPKSGASGQQQPSGTVTTSGVPKPPILFADDSKKTSIWIRGMAPSTKASSVKQLASQYGKVIQAKIFNSRPSAGGDVKNCFALVSFSDSAAMELAITSLHKKNYQGRVLRVEKRIAQEKLEAEQQKKKALETPPPAAPPTEEKKKRATITAPEATPPKKTAPQKARQTIQAPSSSTSSQNNNVGEKRVKHPKIQPPARSKSREKGAQQQQQQQKRKPITYDEDLATERESPERDSRRIIAPARPSRVQRSPIRANSRQGGRAGGAESLMISARVDTSNCRGRGVTIKRSVERIVPNNISTSQLRRNAPQQQQTAPRASYQTEQYSRERSGRYEKSPIRERGGETRRSDRSDRGGHRGRHQEHLEHHQEYSYVEYGHPEPQQDSGRRGKRREQEQHLEQQQQQQPQQSKRRQQQQQQQHDDQEAKAREMLALLKRKEEEHRIREERLEIEKEKEKIRFEAEKLERTRLELELAKQKMALEQAAMAIAASGDRRARGVASVLVDGDRGRGGARGGTTQDSGSRRRQATEILVAPQATKAMHREHGASRTATGAGGTSSGRRGAESYKSHTSTTTSYGIQSGGAGIRTTSDYTRMMEQPQTRGAMGGGGSSNYGNPQMGGFAGYGYVDSGAAYQQVWPGIGSQGSHLSTNNDTNWTSGATPSSSTSSGGAGNSWGHQNNYSSSTSSSSRRDYGYQRNNY